MASPTLPPFLSAYQSTATYLPVSTVPSEGASLHSSIPSDVLRPRAMALFSSTLKELQGYLPRANRIELPICLAGLTYHFLVVKTDYLDWAQNHIVLGASRQPRYVNEATMIPLQKRLVRCFQAADIHLANHHEHDLAIYPLTSESATFTIAVIGRICQSTPPPRP